MYQLKAEGGYEIHVMQKHCRLVNSVNITVKEGSYEELVAWLLDRGLRLLGNKEKIRGEEN